MKTCYATTVMWSGKFYPAVALYHSGDEAAVPLVDWHYPCKDGGAAEVRARCMATCLDCAWDATAGELGLNPTKQEGES